MKYNRADRTKVIVLSAVLLVVVAYIAVRAVQLRAEYRGMQHEHDIAHAASADPELSDATASGDDAQASLMDEHPLLKALVYPPVPPERDPFYPVIAPPSSGRARPMPSRPEPVAAAELPPLTSGGADRDRLRVTGIISGSPAAAVIRVGDKHLVVREGDWLDNDTRVQAIGTNTVTLREGRRSYILRLGR
jgi:hypothetical protein